MKNEIIALLVFILACVSAACGQPVYKVGNSPQPPDSKFKSVFEKTHSEKYFWIGYSISKSDGRSIFSGSFYYDKHSDRISLRDIIDGTIKYQNYKSLSSSVKNKRNSGRSIRIENGVSITDDSDKETALLFLYDKNSKAINDVVELSVCGLSNFFDLLNYPLFWLGKIEIKTSFEFVSNLYKKSGNKIYKEELLPGIGIHTGVPEATSLLIEIVKNEKDIEIRKDAVFWLGLQNNAGAFTELKKIIYKDSSREIKKDAVTSLGLIELSAATDELINIARHNSDEELRKHAVFGLGSKAVAKAEEALKNIIEDDPDIEIKKHAVYALANNSNNMIPYLINIAKTHPSVTIRKCAIWSLGNSDDARAIDALIALAKK